jgi:hypothetical protein
MSGDILTANFTLRDGAEILALVSELGDERVLQMTHAEARQLRDILVHILDGKDER